MAKQLKWLIAHQPAYLFVRTAEAFAQEVDKILPGRFEIEVLTMGKYIKKYGDIADLNLVPGSTSLDSHKSSGLKGKETTWKGVDSKWKNFFQALRDERIHLSQTQATVIGGHLYPKFRTLDLPFLFNDHDHVTRALDGQVGEGLLEELTKETGVRGLAYTYSGGYRIIGSNHKIGSLDELKTVNLSSVSAVTATWKATGVNAIDRTKVDIQELRETAENNGAVETTYLRFDGSNVLKSNHSMFLTSILIGEEFFKSLEQDEQDAFKKAAKIVAKLERQWSLEDAEKYEREAEAKGIEIVDMSDADRESLKLASKHSYAGQERIAPGSLSLVNKIKSA